VAAHRFGELPRYELTEDGPEHEKLFRAVVRLGGASWGEGEGRTKKEAEQAAAREATDRLDRDAEDGGPSDGEDTAGHVGGNRHA
jgi:ribonuclease-3